MTISLARHHGLLRRIGSRSRLEDPLTEALAGVMERVPTLALRLVRAWASGSVDRRGEAVGSSTVTADMLTDGRLANCRTQVHTAEGKRVDLVLRFAQPGDTWAQQVLVFVEVKLGAKPHSGQLESYLRELDSRDRGLLVLPRVTRDPIDKYLLEELLTYMAEEGLVAPEALLPEHLAALSRMQSARLGVEALTEQISALLRHRRSAADEQLLERKRPAFGLGYWETRNLTPDARLDWSIDIGWSHALSAQSGVLMVCGVIRDKVAPVLAEPTHDRERVLTHGVRAEGHLLRFEWASDDVERFAVYATPAEVLSGRTLEEQADSAARWIMACWHALEAPLDQLNTT